MHWSGVKEANNVNTKVLHCDYSKSCENPLAPFEMLCDLKMWKMLIDTQKVHIKQ